MRVAWTRLATEQLDEAMAYIANDRPAVATRWLEQILDHADSLADYPDRGRIVEEARRDDVRELIVNPYRLIYRCDEEVVYVTMLFHARRNLDLWRDDLDSLMDSITEANLHEEVDADPPQGSETW